jgi:hypothetical protein
VTSNGLPGISVDVIADAIPEEERNKKAKSVPAMIKRFKKHYAPKLADQKPISAMEMAPLDSPSKRPASSRPGWIRQFGILFVRAWRNNIRTPMILWAQLVQYVILALFVGLMYLRVGAKSVDPAEANNVTIVNDRIASIFFSVLNVSFVAAMTAAFVFPAERPIFNRGSTSSLSYAFPASLILRLGFCNCVERSAGHYGVLPYYLSLTLSDMPMQITMVVGNAAVSYWMVRYPLPAFSIA